MAYIYKKRVNSKTAGEVQAWIGGHGDLVSTKSIQDIKGSSDKDVMLQVIMLTSQEDRNRLTELLGNPEVS